MCQMPAQIKSERALFFLDSLLHGLHHSSFVCTGPRRIYRAVFPQAKPRKTKSSYSFVRISELMPFPVSFGGARMAIDYSLEVCEAFLNSLLSLAAQETKRKNLLLLLSIQTSTTDRGCQALIQVVIQVYTT